MIKKESIVIFAALLVFSIFSPSVFANPSVNPIASAAAENVIKKSSSGICHDTDSRFYSRTKNFIAYDTMALCVESGARPYKGYGSNIDRAEKEAIEEGRAFVSLYNRDDWEHWTDDDGDCQTVRHELLISTSKRDVTFTRRDQCIVKTGLWVGLYSAKSFTNASELQIDHVVPLKWAHGHGGATWSKEKKRRFANDPINLLAVQGTLNQSKGAKGPDEWLPPNHPYRCQYIVHFNRVVEHYGLAYIPSEKRIVDRLVKACSRAR